MSALFSPCWVRWAQSTLSTFTAIAGRSGAVCPASSGTPVRGIRTTGAVVVGAAVVGGSVVVVVVVLVDVVDGSVVARSVVVGAVVSAALSPPLHAASAASPAASSSAGRRRARRGDVRSAMGVMSELSQQADPLLERWVRVEQLVERTEAPLVSDATHGLFDPQVCRSRGRGVRHRGVLTQLFQGRDEAWWIPRELARADICQRLPAAGDRRLHDL